MEQFVKYTTQGIPYNNTKFQSGSVKQCNVTCDIVLLLCYWWIPHQTISLVVPCVWGGEVLVCCTSRLRCTNLLCMVVLLVYASQCYGMLTNNRREKAVLHCNTFFFAAAVIDIDDID